MKKLTAENCREQFEEWFADHAGQTVAWVKSQRASDTHYKIGPEIQRYWLTWQASRETLELALPILEQQESKQKVTISEGFAALSAHIDSIGGYNFETLRAEQEDRAEKCTWKYDDSDYYWSSACGEDWCFTDGGPEENRVRYCQGCGRPVELEQQEQPTNQNGEQ